MLNFYSRAGRVVSILKNPLALKVLLELYPSKKLNAQNVSQELGVSISEVDETFLELEQCNFIADNPSSGNKILTEQAKFFLEQTATIFPELKEFLEERERIGV